jgi:hypothetical protein
LGDGDFAPSVNRHQFNNRITPSKMNTADKEVLAVLQENWALQADRFGTTYKEEKQRYLAAVRKQNEILKEALKNLELQLQTTS